MGNVDVSTASRIVRPSVNVKTVQIHMQQTLRKKTMMNMSRTVNLMGNQEQMRKWILSSLMLTMIWIEMFINLLLIFSGKMGVS